jgi:hypothetical protein
MNNPRKSLLDELDEIDGTDYDPVMEDEDFGEEELSSGSDSNVPADVSDNLGNDAQADGTTHPVDQSSPAPVDGQPAKKEEFQQQRGGYHTDSKGNIVDPRDGTVIAKAGSERRLYEKTVRIQSQMNEVSQERDRYKSYVQSAGNLANEIQKHGFTPNELKEYMDTAVLYKSNPLEAVKRMVANVAALGYNVSEIVGGSVGDAIELKAVSRMLDERLAPLTKERQQQEQATKVQEQFNSWLNDFVSKHEYADVHLNAMDRLVGDNPGLTAERAYFEMKTFAAKHGLDFSQPLQPQILAKQAASAQRQPAQQPRAQSRTPSAPRSSAPSSNRQVSEPDMAPSNASWDDIIRGTMRPR